MSACKLPCRYEVVELRLVHEASGTFSLKVSGKDAPEHWDELRGRMQLRWDGPAAPVGGQGLIEELLAVLPGILAGDRPLHY